MDSVTDDLVALLPQCQQLTSLDLSYLNKVNLLSSPSQKVIKFNWQVSTLAIGKAVAQLPNLTYLEMERVLFPILQSPPPPDNNNQSDGPRRENYGRGDEAYFD